MEEMALDSVALEKGEKVKELYPDVRIVTMPTITPFVYGAFVLTTRRLVWIQKLGKSFRVFLDFPLEKLKEITTNHGRFRKTVAIVDDKSTYTFTLVDVDEEKFESFPELIYSMIEERKEEIKKEEQKASRSVVMDFSTLKEYMKTGGLNLKSFKCPNCGALIQFPEGGETVECSSCSSTVKAEEIYEKVRSLI
jgi:LSD1 subclass zinc finger protein